MRIGHDLMDWWVGLRRQMPPSLQGGKRMCGSSVDYGGELVLAAARSSMWPQKGQKPEVVATLIAA